MEKRARDYTGRVNTLTHTRLLSGTIKLGQLFIALRKVKQNCAVEPLNGAIVLD